MASNSQVPQSAPTVNTPPEEDADPLVEYILTTIAPEFPNLQSFPLDESVENDPEYQLADYFLSLVRNFAKVVKLVERIIERNGRMVNNRKKEHHDLSKADKGAVPILTQGAILSLWRLRPILRQFDEENTPYNDCDYSRARIAWYNSWYRATRELANTIPVPYKDRKGYAEVIFNGFVKKNWEDDLEVERQKEAMLGPQKGTPDISGSNPAEDGSGH